MGKNIILFSDGTGNKGGYGADTNVYRLYASLALHDKANPQVAFYDDGVGTDTNKYIRALTGAFGLGFGANIKDLYKFLARHYIAGDRICLFGFSRGAATVRAFAGMVQECGLLDINSAVCQTNGRLDERKFQDRIGEAFRAYEKIKSNPTVAAGFKARNGVTVNSPGLKSPQDVPIKFIGVWDTVSALGVPQDWSWAFKGFFWSLDKLSDILFPHNFYNYQLNRNVEQVCHALAIDDERTTFHPKVWNEKRPDRPRNIEQVWFAGVHSNIGGGYPRTELSSITLEWMLARARSHGVVFNSSIEAEARAAANVHGKLYDSRDGFAVYYRYAPRNIERLCEGKLDGSVQIHQTVVERIRHGTGRYAPGHLPSQYKVVDTPIGSPSQPKQWSVDRSAIIRWVAARKTLYRLFVEASLALVAVSIYFWMSMSCDLKRNPDGCELKKLIEGARGSGVAKDVNDILHYFLPEFIEPFITYAVIVNPYVSSAILVVLFAIYKIRGFLRERTQRACEEAHR